MIPIFPLGAVLLPEMTMPLNIFEERQRFLEMTSARERLEKGFKVLEKVIARAKISQEIAELIGGNGHLRSFLTEKGRQV